MRIDEAVKRACEESTLLDALSWIAVWESDRVVRQAKHFFETGERTGAHPGTAWDTCFEICFKQVFEEWKD